MTQTRTVKYIYIPTVQHQLISKSYKVKQPKHTIIFLVPYLRKTKK